MTLEEGAVVLKFREYDPYVHDYGRYLVARTKEFSASMERYLDRLAKETSRTGMVEGYRGNKLEHYEWVVCFQVRNQSYEEIADHYGEKHRGSLDAHHVGAAIQKASKAIGLRTRARPGRPARR